MLTAKTLGTIPWHATVKTQTLEIKGGHPIRDLNLRLTGILAIGVADALRVATEYPYTIIRRIELIGDGVTIRSLSFANMNFDSMLANHAPGEDSSSDGTVGNHNINADAELNLELENAIEGEDTLIDPNKYKLLELRVTWGEYTDLVAPDGATTLAWNTDPLLTVVLRSELEIAGTFALHKQVEIAKDVTADNPEFSIALPGNNPVRKILIKGLAKANAADTYFNPLAAVIENVKLVSDNEFTHRDYISGQLKADNLLMYGLESANWIDGYLILELCAGGDVQDEAIDFADYGQTELILAVKKQATDTKIEVVTSEIVIPPELANILESESVVEGL